jgi:cytochrome c oxidase cbb3-type subunit III
MPTKIEKDLVSGQDTTGHEWDGIKELNTPLPKWWVYLFVATVVFAAGYFLLFPSFPYGTGYFHGLLGYSSRNQAMTQWRDMQSLHRAAMAEIGKQPFAAIQRDPKLMEVALTAGRVTFANDCQPCHGPNGEGRVGYPALGSDVWRWGGTLADIERTVTYGIRSGDPNARNSMMPAFGDTGMLKPEQISQVVDYVMTLFGQPVKGVDVTPGKKIFAENCAMCHGERGQGNHTVGAPPLATHVHLYEESRDSVIAQVTHPRLGVMPNWDNRLDPATIKAVTLYVHSLGGGE